MKPTNRDKLIERRNALSRAIIAADAATWFEQCREPAGEFSHRFEVDLSRGSAAPGAKEARQYFHAALRAMAPDIFEAAARLADADLKAVEP